MSIEKHAALIDEKRKTANIPAAAVATFAGGVDAQE
jgi:hypothetical protein